jgi:hypothetical protein
MIVLQLHNAGWRLTLPSKGVKAMTTHEVLSTIFAALTFEAVFISTIVAIVVAITKKK